MLTQLLTMTTTHKFPPQETRSTVLALAPVRASPDKDFDNDRQRVNRLQRGGYRPKNRVIYQPERISSNWKQQEQDSDINAATERTPSTERGSYKRKKESSEKDLKR